MTDSDNESDEEGDFELVYGRTLSGQEDQYEIMTGACVSQGWCHILMVIRLNLICT